MIRILGIDPGYCTTGFGLVDVDTNQYEYIESGIVKVDKLDLAQRLKKIHQAVCELVEEYRPDYFAIEKVFVKKNVDSALKLGQARGAAICAAGAFDISVSEYAAREVKQTITGSGAAMKQQVQYMVRMLLSLEEVPGSDAADALAIAICHAHHLDSKQRQSGRQSVKNKLQGKRP